MTRVMECLSTLCGGVYRWWLDDRDDEEELQNEEQDLEKENQELQNDIEKLKKTHKKICVLLTDAEEMKIWRESVKLWLSELKDLAYDAEDLIEEYQYEVHQAEADEIEEEEEDEDEDVIEEIEDVAEPEEGQSTNQVSRSLFSVTAIMDFRRKIQMINERYDKIVTERQNLNLEGERVHDPPSLQRASGFLPAEPHIYGREEDRGEILNSLLSDAPVTDGVPTVAIVGMGGLGKTTLAQLLYNDKEVRGLFPTRGWVHVSQDYDVIKLAQSIIQCFTDQPCGLTELSALQTALIKAVEEKKFLLVLDDVWSVDDALCDGILTALMLGASGSRVLMTTRDEMAARRMNLITLHRLGHLADDDCWKLFLRHAFGTSDYVGMTRMQLNMEDIRSKVVEKCRGLPLAARALGGILRFEDDRRRWMHVLESDLWKEDHDKDNGILGALKLSYIHLPARLKRCFGCCSLFPKGYTMSKKDLVYMWMAYGLIEDQNGKSAIAFGIDYINHLIMRSILQPTEHKHGYEAVYQIERTLHEGEYEALYELGRKCILMHDLIHDLAQSVFGEECVKIKESFKHPSYPASYAIAPESMRVRVFFCSAHPGGSTWMDLAGIFIHLKSLRALVLHNIYIRRLPKSIAELKHLRYLDLRYCGFLKKLPGAVCRLYNLQVLLCPERAKLPRNIKNLVNLQYLEVPDHSVFPPPPGIGRLTKLKHLPCFVVGEDKEKHASIGELKHLNNLEEKLAIRHLHKLSRSEDAEAARLGDKEHIVTLELIWRWEHFNEKEETQNDLDQVFEALQPHVNLVNLEIRGYHGPKLPNWLGHPSFDKLAALNLFYCRMCQNLPSLGQLPCLKFLHIEGLRSVKHIGSEFYYFNAHKRSIPCKSKNVFRNKEKPFPLLVAMRLLRMAELEEWSSCGVNEDESFCQFPSLAALAVFACPLLKVIAPAFPSLRRLHLSYCPMLKSLPFVPLVDTLILHGEWDEHLLSSKVLPKLKILDLQSCNGVKVISLYSRFPALEYLEISELLNLERIEFWAPSNVPRCSSPPSSLPSSSMGSSSSLGTSSSMQVGFLHACNQTSSLRSMRFIGCKKLDFPSEERLPQMLGKLYVKDCPKLEDWCIAHRETRLAHVQVGWFD